MSMRSVAFLCGGIGDQLLHFSQLQALTCLYSSKIDIYCQHPAIMKAIILGSEWAGNVTDIKPFKKIIDLQKYKDAPFRAPMIIILVSEIKIHPKVPEIEQMLSTAAAAENILLALNALNYAGMWRTGVFALNEKISKYLELQENQKVNRQTLFSQ